MISEGAPNPDSSSQESKLTPEELQAIDAFMERQRLGPADNEAADSIVSIIKRLIGWNPTHNEIRFVFAGILIMIALGAWALLMPGNSHSGRNEAVPLGNPRVAPGAAH